MEVRIKPVHWLGSTWHVFPRPDGQLEVTTDPAATRARVAALHAELQQRLASIAVFLEPAVVRDAGDVEALRGQLSHVDALLVNVSTGGIEGAWDWELPVIAFSGDRSPMMGLYNLPAAEREKHPNVTLALDFDEVAAQLRGIRARKRLADSKLVILGEYRCADRLPDPERVRRVLGVELVRVSSADFLEQVQGVDEARARARAREWADGATGDGEPSAEEVLHGARIHAALEDVLRREGAQGASVGCLELMYLHGQSPFCFALAALRDVGLPAGCEADAGATLTMLMLEYLAERPAYMGNLVRADPASDELDISHGCSPARMEGRDRPAKAYRLVHSHSVPPFSRDLTGGAGVTSYVDYADVGQEVTIARLGADLDRMLVARAEIVGCRDTICDRTTLTVRVGDARAFVQAATGNHQVVVYGDYVAELRGLCRLLGIQAVGPEPRPAGAAQKIA